MCGFIGIFGKDSNNLREGIKSGLDAIWHRGPDASGIYSDNICSLGHNRLKIIDLSDRSNQPFEDEDFVLVFNGEIYNYLELKDRFGFQTKTSSDTEILFCVLKKFKDDIKSGIGLLNGMFAFALYYKKEKKLVLCRDRLGVKPLYYTDINGTLICASEVKSLKVFLKKMQVNHGEVVNFLVNRISDSGEETFFQRIYQLSPSCYIEFIFDGKGLSDKKIRYWDITNITHRRKIGDEEALNEFKKLFFSSISLRLRSDVPIAVLLSGGLDSSAVASAISYLYPNNELTAISAVYRDDILDETNFITRVGDRYKNIRLHLIEIKKDIFFRKLEQVIYHQETPIADGSMAAHFLLIEKIKELGIKVVLSGQGGDEILAGYIYTFLPAYYADKIRQLRLNHVTIRNVFHALPAVIKNRLKNSVVHNKYGKFFKKNSTLNTIKDFYKHFKNNNILNSYLLNSILYWSLPSFLHYEDRNSMAFSVENRSPYLDYRLVEFMLSLPNDFKIRKGVSKWILRESLKDILPEEIVKRKDKQGFYAPINRWNDSFPEQYLNDINFSREFSYLNFGRIKEDKIMQWRIYTLWLWHKAFIQA